MTGNWWTWIAIQLLAVLITGWLAGCSPSHKAQSDGLNRSDKSDFIAVRSAREADVFCDSDNDCIDTDPTTEDLCLKSGECIHLEECQKASDCPPGLPGVDISCYQGQCVWYVDYLQDCDYDGNLAVDATDLAHLLMGFGPCYALDPRDWDGNGQTDAGDLAELLREWGPRFD